MNEPEHTQIKWRPRWWVVALAAMIAIVATDTIYHAKLTWALSWGDNVVPPALDASSPSGYVNNEHMLILPYQGMDGYHWIMQTQQMLAGGGARIRSVDYDNAPDGREVHWASALRWWMAGLAWLNHEYTGTPLAQAVERIAPYASTLLVVLLVALTTPFLARRLGSVPAAMFAFGVVGVGPIYESFTEGRLDHHGLASLNAIFTVLFLVGGAAGWVRNENPPPGSSPFLAWLPDRRQARRWFIAAGIAGGIGLWISTASEAFLLAETGLGALLATGLLGRGTKPEDGARPDPSLWRIWGWSGAATSLFFYLLEYFPSHFGLRLEVNHPLYALAWAGGGELIFRASRWWMGGRLAENPRDRAWLAFAFLAVGTIPALLYIAANRVFLVSDHFLWMMHQDYIVEFTPLWGFLAGLWNNKQFWDLAQFANPLVLLAVPMIFWACSRSFPRPLRAMLVILLPPGIITYALSMAQVRWIEINYSVWLAALATVALALRLNSAYPWNWPRGLTAGALVIVALLANPGYLMTNWLVTSWEAKPQPIEVLEQIIRDSAQRLRAHVGDGDAVVLSGPTSSTWITYFGGFKTVGTYYWENLPGLKDAADIYGASTPAALKLLQKRNITHMVIFSFVDAPSEYARLAHGLRKEDAAPPDAFMVHLIATQQVPQWLRPIPYSVPAAFRKDVFVRIYELAPEQTPSMAMTRLAQMQLDSGASDDALNLLRKALASDPANLAAVITLARLQIAQNQAENFGATYRQLLNLMPAAVTLEFADHVDLATVLNRTPDQDLMRTQLQEVLREVTPQKLRTLRFDSLYNLLLLTRFSGLDDAHPGLWQMGLTLLPPGLRVQLLIQAADFDKGIGHPQKALNLLRQALDVDPDSLLTLNRLALLLSTTPDPSVRNGREALELAKRAYDIDDGKHVNITDTLACAYAETGDFVQAVEVEQLAVNLTIQANVPELTAILQSHLDLFKKQLPYREPIGASRQN